ncbi:MAG: helix-turn-helix domain-containing protein [Pseudobutyrivibrio sp.]|nr:helix-turn-helix domain-containing protein [Pseudobutyrivibrio sp.]
MTISERVLEILDERKISQKEFSIKTGIPQTTISDWRKKKTNPASDKILIICKVLNVSPEWLLSGIEEDGNRSKKTDFFVISKDTEIGNIINSYNNMDIENKKRMELYVNALLKK